MHITFVQLCGVLSIGLGCYALLSIPFQKLRARNWQGQPANLLILAACGCVLLGLWAFGIGRPYTWIATLLVWGVGFLIECRRLRENSVVRVRIMQRREAVVLLVILVGMIAVMLRIFLGSK